MFQFILSTQDGEILGVFSDLREAREDAREVAEITKEPIALHQTLEEECVLMVGDLISGRAKEWIRPTISFTSVRARAKL